MAVFTAERPFWFTRRTTILRKEKIVVVQPKAKPQFELHKTLAQGISGDESNCVSDEVINERIRQKHQASRLHNNTIIEVSKMTNRQFEIFLDQLRKPKKIPTVLWQNNSELFEEQAGPVIQTSELMQ